MKAILFTKNRTLELKEVNKPRPQRGEVGIKICACGICRTDLHIFEGDLPPPHFPRILGHQIVGTIEELGEGVTQFKKGERVGVPWLGQSCGKCEFCLSGRENLCDYAVFTGYQKDGGFAEYTVADARFIFPLPTRYSDTQIAPLLCAGFIGYRALKATGFLSLPWVKKLGFYGFGSSAHIVAQIVAHRGGEVYAFTRPGDKKGQAFAKEMGAVWVGDVNSSPPLLDAAILFAPAGELVPQALQAVKKGGKVVSAGIHMTDIPSFPYRILWEERSLSSVANLTRQDGEEFLAIADEFDIKTQIALYPLEKTAEGLQDLKQGHFKGSAVVKLYSRFN